MCLCCQTSVMSNRRSHHICYDVFFYALLQVISVFWQVVRTFSCPKQEVAPRLWSFLPYIVWQVFQMGTSVPLIAAAWVLRRRCYASFPCQSCHIVRHTRVLTVNHRSQSHNRICPFVRDRQEQGATFHKFRLMRAEQPHSMSGVLQLRRLRADLHRRCSTHH